MTERRQLIYGVIAWASLTVLLGVLIYFGIGASK